jgi:hypothetical protein
MGREASQGSREYTFRFWLPFAHAIAACAALHGVAHFEDLFDSAMIQRRLIPGDSITHHITLCSTKFQSSVL